MLSILAVLAGNACKTSTSAGDKPTTVVTGDNSRNSLDWAGRYQGIVPCADCEGVNTVIILNQDLTYILNTNYIGKSDSVFQQTGSFTWNDQGSQVTLNGLGDNRPAKFLVGENTLTQLDMQGNRITGDLASKYMLKKSGPSITEKYWKLTELNGKPFTPDSTYRKEPHIIFKEKDSRVAGNSGCNNFTGTYKLNGPNGISFSQMASTRMACLNENVEPQFLKVLEMADNYYVTDSTLVLNRAKMAPLARFVVVYMK